MLIGHPEHDLLFIATQVARAAGLKDPAHAVSAYRKTKQGAGLRLTLAGLLSDSDISLPDDGLGRVIRSNTAMMTEPETYQWTRVASLGNLPREHSWINYPAVSLQTR
ncbi:hypothetical protein PK34_16070 [Stutzerimonas stutzeri]|nr:hypothetical protein PK34_16070 [Stutzerimonas stutzeri]